MENIQDRGQTLNGMRAVLALVWSLIFLAPILGLQETAFSNSTDHQQSEKSSQQDDPYLTCEKGKRQSPINIQSSAYTETVHDLVFQYQPTEIHMIHDGHSLRILNEANNQAFFDGEAYPLLQFHFHEPSEHHLDGVSFPTEMHLVHKNSKGHVLVIGVLFREGSENTELEQAGAWVKKQIGHRILEEGEEVSGHRTIDIMKILPRNLSRFFVYDGSLTTVPCTEGVQWVVMGDSVEISPTQVTRLFRAYGPTARPIQPLHGREIEGQ